ncbi:islet amyloid polypeptide [Protopterus annectens]|uniref:islet amyloid polypeptide n=1 Tax=Protopterus annectens TaxID=7888 RepID=UPI001CFA770C|nr:islet amyloid polypeptide [Protopterus annectens]
MSAIKFLTFLTALSFTISWLEATPANRYSAVSSELIEDSREGWALPILSKNTLLRLTGTIPGQGLQKSKSISHHLEKRKCNTATCVTQRLADYLVRSRNSFGAVYSPTNVGSNTYGKRDNMELINTEPISYLQF